MVEAQIGSIERWPSNLIMDMFLEEPKAGVIKRVSAIFTGTTSA